MSKRMELFGPVDLKEIEICQAFSGEDLCTVGGHTIGIRITKGEPPMNEIESRQYEGKCTDCFHAYLGGPPLL